MRSFAASAATLVLLISGWACVGPSYADGRADILNEKAAGAGPGRALLGADAAAANGGHDYKKILGLSFLFYEAQRAGRLPADQRVKWRRDSVLQDRDPSTGTDLSGGYFDAGDHVKFAMPAAFTVSMLALALSEFPHAFQQAGEERNGLAALKWGADYLERSVLGPNAIVVQVGSGKDDHNIWRRAEDVKETRPVAVCGPGKPASDAAGAIAGALALASIAFRQREAPAPPPVPAPAPAPPKAAAAPAAPAPPAAAAGNNKPAPSAPAPAPPAAAASNNKAAASVPSPAPAGAASNSKAAATPAAATSNSTSSGTSSKASPPAPSPSPSLSPPPKAAAAPAAAAGGNNTAPAAAAGNSTTTTTTTISSNNNNNSSNSNSNNNSTRSSGRRLLAAAGGGDGGYADRLLAKARLAYDFADQQRGFYHTACAPDAAQFYESKSYDDDLAWAALALYRATKERRYLDAALRHYKALRTSPDWGTWRSRKYGFFWDSYAPGVAWMLLREAPAEAAAAGAGEHWQGFLDAWTSLKGNEHVVTSPKGYAWYIKDLGWGNLRHMANAAFLVLLGAKTMPPGAERDRLQCWAHGQVQYALGDGGRSYVVGYGSNPPTRPHHRSASCQPIPAQCDYKAMFNEGPNPQVITGALVGGPDPNDQYKDDRMDARNNEVAIDYNAGWTGALAGLIEAPIDYDSCLAKGLKRVKKG